MIVATAANPHDASALPEIGTYLATYGYTMPAVRAVVGGAWAATGRLSVSI